MTPRPTEEIDWVDTCPHCGRVLVVSYFDGTFDLSGQTSTTLLAIAPSTLGPATVTARPEQGRARCERRLCRLRARLRAR